VNRAFIDQVARFLVVGTLGFAIDGGLLYLLVRIGVDPYLARAFSFPPAVTATWYLNRVWTFAARRGIVRQQYARYLAVQIIGALSNYGVYAAILSLGHRSAEGALAAFAAGSIAGLVINFAGARALVFVAGSSAAAVAE
jgi:putative flippase GtrA